MKTKKTFLPFNCIILLFMGITNFMASCSNNVAFEPQEQNLIKKHQGKKLSMEMLSAEDVGYHHKQILSECAIALYSVDEQYYADHIIDYNPEYYRMFDEYDTIIKHTTTNYLYLIDIPYDAAMQSLANHMNFETPQDLENLFEHNTEICEDYSTIIADAVNYVYDTIYFYLNGCSINENVQAEYWMYFDTHIEDITSIMLHELYSWTNDVEEQLIMQCLVETMKGSLGYWHDTDNLEIWQRHAWYANKNYLGVDGIIPYDPTPVPSPSLSAGTRAKIRDLVLADVSGAGLGAALGSSAGGVGVVPGAIAWGSITSGMIALLW